MQRGRLNGIDELIEIYSKSGKNEKQEIVEIMKFMIAHRRVPRYAM